MAMLHFGGRITFGMDVGDLLQFQRAFKGNRESVSAAQKQKAMSVFVFCSDGADLLISLQGFFYFFGDTIQLMEKFLKPLAANGTPFYSRFQSDHGTNTENLRGGKEGD